MNLNPEIYWWIKEKSKSPD